MTLPIIILYKCHQFLAYKLVYTVLSNRKMFCDSKILSGIIFSRVFNVKKKKKIRNSVYFVDKDVEIKYIQVQCWRCCYIHINFNLVISSSHFKLFDLENKKTLKLNLQTIRILFDLFDSILLFSKLNLQTYTAKTLIFFQAIPKFSKVWNFYRKYFQLKKKNNLKSVDILSFTLSLH